LNGNVDKAEALVANNAASIKKDKSVDWLWGKLESDFGFHPPLIKVNHARTARSFSSVTRDN